MAAATNRLSAIRYYGGKNALGRTGPKIAALLPPVEDDQIYLEPFAGMLGVLLQRRPARAEIASDIDGRLITFWQIMRSQPEELCHRIEWTAMHAQEHRDARAVVRAWDDHDDVTRAWAVAVCLWQGFVPSMHKTGWRLPTARALWPSGRQVADRLAAVAQRISGVLFHTWDAIDAIGRYADHPEAVIYCDPPYPGSDISTYSPEARKLRPEALIEALRDVRGRCAISGYGDAWDALGWRRVEMPTNITVAPTSQVRDAARPETLWCNYDAISAGQGQLDLIGC